MTPDTAAAWLERTAQNSGLVFDPAALPDAAQHLAETVERDPTGRFSYRDAPPFRIVAGDVVDVPIEEHLAAVFLKHARPIPEATPAAAQAAPDPTAKPIQIEVNTPIAALGRAFAASHDAAVLREAETWENPFLAGPNFNRTRQQVLTNKHPARAAQLKAQAGK